MDLSNAKLLAKPKTVDIAKAVDGPAIQVNKFFLLTTTVGIRIVFAEQVMPEGDVSFRTAINLTKGELADFSEVLIQFVEQLEIQEGNGNGKNTNQNAA